MFTAGSILVLIFTLMVIAGLTWGAGRINSETSKPKQADEEKSHCPERRESMTVRRALSTAWVAVLIGALAACGGSPNKPATEGLTVDVTIAGGQVTPANETLQAKVAQQITLKVTSDATDELHVHSTPDHKFAVAAAPNQTFQFSVDVPGNVEVELHHLKRTIAAIQVRP